MKVAKAIEKLSKYNMEDELIIDWWSKDSMQDWFEEDDGYIIDDNLWLDVVDNFEYKNVVDFTATLIEYISENIVKIDYGKE